MYGSAWWAVFTFFTRRHIWSFKPCLEPIHVRFKWNYIALRNSQSNISLSSCLLFTSMKQHLDMYTHKVGTQQRRRLLATFDITIHNRYKDLRYVLGYLLMFQFGIKSNSILILVLWLYNWDCESVSPNRKLNLITWWICFPFKKVVRRSAIIHVFTKTPPIHGSRKVVQFMQNEPQFILYRAQRTNVNTCYCFENLAFYQKYSSSALFVALF